MRPIGRTRDRPYLRWHYLLESGYGKASHNLISFGNLAHKKIEGWRLIAYIIDTLNNKLYEKNVFSDLLFEENGNYTYTQRIDRLAYYYRAKENRKRLQGGTAVRRFFAWISFYVHNTKPRKRGTYITYKANCAISELLSKKLAEAIEEPFRCKLQKIRNVSINKDISEMIVLHATCPAIAIHVCNLSSLADCAIMGRRATLDKYIACLLKGFIEFNNVVSV